MKYGKGAIVLVIIIAVVAIGFIVKAMLNQEPPKPEYFIATGASQDKSEKHLITKRTKLRALMSSVNMIDELQNGLTFKKSVLTETFNDEFFANNYLAYIDLYEDNTCYYEYSIDKVELSEDGSLAKVYYIYKAGTFSESLKSSRHKFLFVAVPTTVTSVETIKVSK